jgi:hypothetical protein
MSTYFDQAQVIQTTQTESQEDMGMLPGTESHANLLFESGSYSGGCDIDVRDQQAHPAPAIHTGAVAGTAGGPMGGETAVDPSPGASGTEGS